MLWHWDDITGMIFNGNVAGYSCLHVLANGTGMIYFALQYNITGMIYLALQYNITGMIYIETSMIYNNYNVKWH